jgi:hypothetical protein
MKNPTIHAHSTMGQVPTGGKISSSGPVPLRGQPPLHISTGGKPPFIGETLVVT